LLKYNWVVLYQGPLSRSVLISNLEGCAPLRQGQLRPPTSVTSGILIHTDIWPQYKHKKQELSKSWDGRPFGHNRHGLKMWGCAAVGELGPMLYITLCIHNVAWAEVYLRTKWHLDPSTVWPQYTNVTDRTHRQRSDSIGRTVLQTVAQTLIIWHPISAVWQSAQ